MHEFVQSVEVQREVDLSHSSPSLLIAAKLKLPLERVQDEMTVHGSLSNLEQHIGAEVLAATRTAIDVFNAASHGTD